MKSDIYRYAGEVRPADITISPLADRGVGTIQGTMANNWGTRGIFSDAIEAELGEHDQICFSDTDENSNISVEYILDRFEDATGGISPGLPTIKSLEDVPDVTPDAMLGSSEELVAARLQRFYELSGMHRRPYSGVAVYDGDNMSWGGDANKFYARVRVPKRNPSLRSFAHELGHCGLQPVGFVADPEITIDGTEHSTYTHWNIVYGGLTYLSEGVYKGNITEEAVAEGLGTIVNKKLGLVTTHADDEVSSMPEVVAPYIEGVDFSMSSPSAVALELIAQQLDIQPERYFRMFADYADAGVLNPDARQEVAETVYRGTRGRLTLGMIEELPYPISLEASLALLWAVEDSLDTPDNERCSNVFMKLSKYTIDTPPPFTASYAQ